MTSVPFPAPLLDFVTRDDLIREGACHVVLSNIDKLFPNLTVITVSEALPHLTEYERQFVMRASGRSGCSDLDKYGGEGQFESGHAGGFGHGDGYYTVTVDDNLRVNGGIGCGFLLGNGKKWRSA